MARVSEVDRLFRRAGGVEEVRTLVEVGACHGEESLALASRSPHTRVVAIEPVHDLADALREKSADLPNYTVVEEAIAAGEEGRTFHVFPEAPHLSSLNRISEDGNERYRRTTEEAEDRHVQTKTLSSICDELGIDSIDVLHIDTQGSDLEVLASLDEQRLTTVKALSVEATRTTPLYEAAPSGAVASERLRRSGFRIFRVDRVVLDYPNECNYFFTRSSEWEQRLGIPLLRYFLSLAACDARALVMRVRNRMALRTRLRDVLSRP